MRRWRCCRRCHRGRRRFLCRRRRLCHRRRYVGVDTKAIVFFSCEVVSVIEVRLRNENVLGDDFPVIDDAETVAVRVWTTKRAWKEME